MRSGELVAEAEYSCSAKDRIAIRWPESRPQLKGESPHDTNYQRLWRVSPAKPDIKWLRRLVAVQSLVFIVIVVATLVAVPSVVMFDTAMRSVPVASKVLLAIVMRFHPMRSNVRWPSPITSVPPVMSTYGIPITVYPDVVGSWTYWANRQNARRRWRPNSDTKRNLGTSYW